MLLGNVIFPGRAKAALFEYERGCTLDHPAILFVSALTTDVAFFILSNPVCGIISEESSFATHGANILRCFYKNHIENLVWVSGVRKSDIQLYFQKEVCIFPDGRVDVTDNIDILDNECKRIITAKHFVPLEKRSIIEYNISSKCYKVCFWPHRRFNALTFSVMKSGLEHNMNLLFGVDSTITLDEQGQIWFADATLLGDIICLATDITKSNDITQRNILLNVIFDLLLSMTA